MLGLVVVFAIISIALTTNKRREKTNPRGKKEYNYEKKSAVLSKNEQEWYWRLVEALPRNVILAQVNMTSCINTKNDQASFGTISQKSLDFIICNKEMNIVAAVEIDDASHNSQSAMKRDNTKNQALDAAGIKLIRWKAMPVATKEEIIKKFANAILGRQQ